MHATRRHRYGSGRAGETEQHARRTSAADQRGAPDDATRTSDISFYRQSALGRLMTVEAARRARGRGARRSLMLRARARRDPALDLPRRPVRHRRAGARSSPRSCWPRSAGASRATSAGRWGRACCARFDPGTASTVSFLRPALHAAGDRDRRAADRGPRPARDRARRRGHGGRDRPRGAEHARQRDRRDHAAGLAAVQGRRARAPAGRHAGRDGRGHGREPGTDLHHVRARQQRCCWCPTTPCSSATIVPLRAPGGRRPARAAAPGRDARASFSGCSRARCRSRPATSPTSRSRRCSRTAPRCAITGDAGQRRGRRRGSPTRCSRCSTKVRRRGRPTAH